MELNLILPLPTSLNRLYINQATFNPKTKTYVPTGKRILSKDGIKTKARIQGEAILQLKQQNWDFEKTKTHFVFQDVIIHFARRGSDSDNIFKLLNDSVESIVVANDCMMLSRVQKVVYDSNNPHIEVKYTFSEQIGVFDNRTVLELFEDTCKDCTRYRNGKCSILKDSIAGTVREEIGSIHSPKCSSFKSKIKF